AGRTVGGDRHPPACGDCEGNGGVEHARAADRGRRRRQRHAHAGGVRRDRSRGHRALREDHQGSGIEDRLTMKITNTRETLGATIEGLDLARPLTDEQFDGVVRALGERGVVPFPRQKPTGRQPADFSRRFGDLEINVASAAYQEADIPEVMILSNIVEDGKPIGLADAGQDWHTDMSYSRTIAFANVLYAVKVPRRDGVTLGNTEFSNMHAAYDDLPDDVK